MKFEIINTTFMNITNRQRELHDFIKSKVLDKGFPPTLSEMAKALRLKSKNAVAKLLRALEEEDLIKRDGTARGIRIFDEYGNEVRAGSVIVPLLGMVPAGGPLVVDEYVEEWVNVPATLTAGRKDVFILRVKGDSMERAGILEGDMVIVKPTRDIKNNDIVVALLHDEATVKRFIEIPPKAGRRSRKYLKPENPKYENIYPEDEWTTQGKVVGVIRRY